MSSITKYIMVGTFKKRFRASRCAFSIFLQLSIPDISTPYKSIGAMRLSNIFWKMPIEVLGSCLNPLSPHDALKHHFTSLKTYLIFLQPRVLERKFPWDWSTNTWQFSLIFKPHQVIFIHYKSRIATAIRGLWWMKMTMVNSGLKGLLLHPPLSTLFSLWLWGYYIKNPRLRRTWEITQSWQLRMTSVITQTDDCERQDYTDWEGHVL